MVGIEAKEFVDSSFDRSRPVESYHVGENLRDDGVYARSDHLSPVKNHG